MNMTETQRLRHILEAYDEFCSGVLCRSDFDKKYPIYANICTKHQFEHEIAVATGRAVVEIGFIIALRLRT